MSCTMAAGHTFKHWINANTGAVVSTSQTFDITLNYPNASEACNYYNFMACEDTGEEKYKVTLLGDECGGVSGGGEFSPGETATITAWVDDETCCEFEKWTGDYEGTDNPHSFTVDKDYNITAQFKRKKFLLKASVTDPRGKGTPGVPLGEQGEIECGTQVTLDVFLYDCYKWDSNCYWYCPETARTIRTKSFTTTVNENQTWTAYIPMPQYTVTAGINPSGGGTVDGDGTFYCGTEVSLTATPNSCYEFTGWTGDYTSDPKPLRFALKQDRSVTANFRLKQFTITTRADAVNHGRTWMTPTSGKISCGDSVTLHFEAFAGYHFVNWTSDKDGSSTNPNYTYTPEQDENWTAHFEAGSESSSPQSGSSSPEPEEFTVTVQTNGGGTVSGGGKFKKHERCTITATPNPGCKFLWWESEDGERDVPVYTFEVTKDITWTAVFDCSGTSPSASSPSSPSSLSSPSASSQSSPESGYTVTVIADGCGDVSGGGHFEYGDICTIVAAEWVGGKFTKWDSGTRTVFSKVYKFPVTGDITWTAHFDCESSESPTSSSSSGPCELHRIGTVTAGGGQTAGDGDYCKGSLCTISATPDPGCRFVKWESESGRIIFVANYTFKVTEDQIWEAYFDCSSSPSASSPSSSPSSSSPSSQSSPSAPSPSSPSYPSSSSQSSPSSSSSSESGDIHVYTGANPGNAVCYTTGTGVYDRDTTSIVITQKRKCSPWTFKHWLIKVNDDCMEVTEASPDVRPYATAPYPVYITCLACYSHSGTGKLFYPKGQPDSLLKTKDGDLVYDGKAMEAATCN